MVEKKKKFCFIIRKTHNKTCQEKQKQAILKINTVHAKQYKMKQEPSDSQGFSSQSCLTFPEDPQVGSQIQGLLSCSDLALLKEVT